MKNLIYLKSRDRFLRRSIKSDAPLTSTTGSSTSVFSGFSFGAVSNNSTTSSSSNPFQNINLAASLNTTPLSNSLSSSTLTSGTATSIETALASSSTNNLSTNTNYAITNSDSDEYIKRTKKLNKSFLTWTEHQIEENAVAVWKDAVQDYINYQNKLKEKYTKPSLSTDTETASSKIENKQENRKEEVISKITTTTVAPTSIAGTFTSSNLAVPAKNSSTVSFDFGTKPNSTSTNESANKVSFTFGAAPMNSTTSSVAPSSASVSSTQGFDSKPGFSFPGASGFSFNPGTSNTVNPTSSDTSKSGFSFTFGNGSNNAFSNSAPSSFAFGSSLGTSNSNTSGGFGGFGSVPSSGGAASVVAGTGGDEDGGEGGDDEEGMPMLEPEKILRNDQDTDEILIELPSKLKVFDKEDNEWKEIGKGTFRITKDIATQKKRILVRNTMGKITLNANFYAGMKFDVVKGALRFSAVVAKMEKGKPTGETEFRMYLVKLSKEEINKAKQLLDEIVASLPTK